MSKITDVVVASIFLVFFSPIIIVSLIFVFLYDMKNPIFCHKRVGKNGEIFDLYKIRTMFIGADKNKVDTTLVDDVRVTKVGRILRKFKLDETVQFINVLIGNMSIVGPRPNVTREVMLYTDMEKKLLSVKPGITDFSSITFSNLGELLQGYDDANIAYNQLIRPWKSKLGLLYVENKSFCLDVKIILITFLSIFSTNLAKLKLCKILRTLSSENELLDIVSGVKPLYPKPPLGAENIVFHR